MRCEDVARLLPETIEGGTADLATQRHIGAKMGVRQFLNVVAAGDCGLKRRGVGPIPLTAVG